MLTLCRQDLLFQFLCFSTIALSSVGGSFWRNVLSSSLFFFLLFIFCPFSICFYISNLPTFAPDFVLKPNRYTAASELLPLLAAGSTPLLKVKSICQSIETSSRTIVNSTTLSSPFATFSFSASATFEVRSPSRIQVILVKILKLLLFCKQDTFYTCSN